MSVSRHHRDLIIGGTLLLVALGLRLWGLGSKSLWSDEGSSWKYAQEPLLSLVTNTQEYNPPLYYALLHEWIKLFGTSEAVLRFPSVLCGVAGVALLGWVGCLLTGRSLAWIAMGLLSVMLFPLKYDQSARTYSLFLAASLASYGCLIAWERSRRRKWAIGYALSTILMSYAHNYWIFNVMAQQLYLGWKLYKKRVSWSSWAWVTGAVAVGVMPWLLVLMKQTVHVARSGFWIPQPTWQTLVRMPLVYVDDERRPFIAWICAALAGFSFLRLDRAAPSATKKPRPAFALRFPLSGVDGLLLLWLLCPLVLPFILSQFGTPIFLPRYTIAAAPAFYLLIGRWLLTLPQRSVQVALGGLIALLSLTALPHYYAQEDEDWRGAATTIERLGQPGDAIVLYSRQSSAFRYYFRGKLPIVSHGEMLSQQPPSFHGPQDLWPAKAHISRTWLVIWNVSGQDNDRLITKALVEQYPGARLVYQHQFTGDLFVYGYNSPQAEQLRARIKT